MNERVKSHNQKIAGAFVDNYPGNSNASLLVGLVIEDCWQSWYDMCWLLSHSFIGMDGDFDHRVISTERVVFADIWLYKLMCHAVDDTNVLYHVNKWMTTATGDAFSPTHFNLILESNLDNPYKVIEEYFNMPGSKYSKPRSEYDILRSSMDKFLTYYFVKSKFKPSQFEVTSNTILHTKYRTKGFSVVYGDYNDESSQVYIRDQIYNMHAAEKHPCHGVGMNVVTGEIWDAACFIHGTQTSRNDSQAR